MENGGKEKVKAVYYEEARNIFDRIKNITAQQNELHNKEFRQKLFDKFTDRKKDKS